MLWAAVALVAYAVIRTSTVGEAMAVGAVSLVVALPLIDYFSTHHRIRRTAAALLATLMASLRSESRPGKQRI